MTYDDVKKIYSAKKKVVKERSREKRNVSEKTIDTVTALVRKYGSISRQELIFKSGMSKSTVASGVDYLEENGLARVEKIVIAGCVNNIAIWIKD